MTLRLIRVSSTSCRSEERIEYEIANSGNIQKLSSAINDAIFQYFLKKNRYFKWFYGFYIQRLSQNNRDQSLYRNTALPIGLHMKKYKVCSSTYQQRVEEAKSVKNLSSNSYLKRKPMVDPSHYYKYKNYAAYKQFFNRFQNRYQLQDLLKY